jgi:hypothetical protein
MTDPTPPAIDPERAVEVAWLPGWQAQLVLHELWETGVPCVLVEDMTSHLRMASFQPMARIFVMEPRRDAALAVIEATIGDQPPTLVR